MEEVNEVDCHQKEKEHRIEKVNRELALPTLT
jgi:hypothetical protein